MVITGTNLAAATSVKFGTAAATGLTANTANSITVTSPAGTRHGRRDGHDGRRHLGDLGR